MRQPGVARIPLVYCMKLSKLKAMIVTDIVMFVFGFGAITLRVASVNICLDAIIKLMLEQAPRPSPWKQCQLLHLACHPALPSRVGWGWAHCWNRLSLLQQTHLPHLDSLRLCPRMGSQYQAEDCIPQPYIHHIWMYRGTHRSVQYSYL